jgi:DNA-binding CsgD family transcriptional regulator
MPSSEANSSGRAEQSSMRSKNIASNGHRDLELSGRRPLRQGDCKGPSTEIIASLADALTALSGYLSHAHGELLQLHEGRFDFDLVRRHTEAIESELNRLHRLLRMLGGSVPRDPDEASAPKSPPASEAMYGWSKEKRRLTKREREVLQLIAQGYTNKRGALALNISHRTFESHRSEVMAKLGVRNTAALVRAVCERPNDFRLDLGCST